MTASKPEDLIRESVEVRLEIEIQHIDDASDDDRSCLAVLHRVRTRRLGGHVDPHDNAVVAEPATSRTCLGTRWSDVRDLPCWRGETLGARDPPLPPRPT